VAPPAAEASPRRSRAAQAPRGQRLSSGTTLVAGVGVLLLAIGLGVLIGRLGHNNTPAQKQAAPEVVTVQGGGGGAASTAAATTPTHTTAAAPSKAPKGLTGKLKAAAENKAPPTKAVQQKATQAAGKVLGSSNNLAPPTQKVGGSCKSGQAGCQSGKFTGNFFGQ
jgi:type IV secretory pathway VirB10-like protein